MSRAAVICVPLLSPPMVDVTDVVAFTLISSAPGMKNQTTPKTRNAIPLPAITQKRARGWLGMVK